MKKQLIRVCGALALLAVMAAPMASNAEAKKIGCGNWTTYSSSTSSCDSDDGCGFLWLKDTNKYTVYQKRQCVYSDNSTAWEYKNYDEKTGCCQ